MIGSSKFGHPGHPNLDWGVPMDVITRYWKIRIYSKEEAKKEMKDVEKEDVVGFKREEFNQDLSEYKYLRGYMIEIVKETEEYIEIKFLSELRYRWEGRKHWGFQEIKSYYKLWISGEDIGLKEQYFVEPLNEILKGLEFTIIVIKTNVWGLPIEEKEYKYKELLEKIKRREEM